MNLILDTSILIELQRGNKEVISRINELRKIYPAPAKISFISYFEFLYGIRDKSNKNKSAVLGFIEIFEVINITKKTASFLVELKRKYELPLSHLLIATQTIESNSLLATKYKDFEMIKELSKEIIWWIIKTKSKNQKLYKTPKYLYIRHSSNIRGLKNE